MNRRQKIIVSVTGIFLVMLILVGLTYAYFLTRIVGNTNNKSIGVQTANLELEYGDGTTELLTSSTKLVPSSNPINTKDFTVENKGDDTHYAVIIENVRAKVAGTDTLTTFDSNDFKYTLTCTKEDGTSCNGVSTQTILPMSDNILVENDIDSGNTHTYVITVWYLDNGNDQSSDMNKTLQARINIEDPNRINPYSNNTNSLVYNIINNALNVSEYGNGDALYMREPLTKVAEESSSSVGGNSTLYVPALAEIVYYASNTDDLYSCVDNGDCDNVKEYTTCTNDVIGKYVWDDYDWTYYGPVTDCIDGEPVIGNAESVLSVTEDDYGDSYYFRGNVEDNYLNFAGMCWRIVRIDGNDNIKIILEDGSTTCNNASFTGNWKLGEGNFGYDSTMKSTDGSTLYKMNYLEPKTEAESSMVKAFYDYQSTLNTKIGATYTNKTLSDYLVSGNWCMNDKAYGSESVDLLSTNPLTNDEINSKYLSKTPFYYDSHIRLYGNKDTYGYSPTLKCNGKTMDKFKNVTVEGTTIITESDMYVGTLTADEITFAGGKFVHSNRNYYLINDYQESNGGYWWSLSPTKFYAGIVDCAFDVRSRGVLGSDRVGHDYGFRPAVTLSSSVEILSGGVGTKTNPYVIK